MKTKFKEEVNAAYAGVVSEMRVTNPQYIENSLTIMAEAIKKLGNGWEAGVVTSEGAGPTLMVRTSAGQAFMLTPTPITR